MEESKNFSPQQIYGYDNESTNSAVEQYVFVVFKCDCGITSLVCVSSSFIIASNRGNNVGIRGDEWIEIVRCGVDDPINYKYRENYTYWIL